METSQNTAAAKELLVTGVSRSGRVRKKSSKLLDFQSPDELEKKPKRIAKPSRYSISGARNRTNSGTAVAFRARRTFGGPDDVALDDEQLQEDEMLDVTIDGDEHFGDDNASGGVGLLAPDSSDDGLDELVADLVGGVEAESIEHANNNGESRVRQSLYMTEKANKRKMLKDGKVVTGKQERKDKGKSRYTAYSLWAREFRKTSKFSKNQDLDFSSTARRLGELWANVSNKEKSAWRRKAKIQATKAKAREKAVPSASSSFNNNSLNPAAAGNSSFHNRATTSRTRKLAADKQQETKPSENNDPASSPMVIKRKRNNSYKTTNNVTNTADTPIEPPKTVYLHNNNSHKAHLSQNSITNVPHSRSNSQQATHGAAAKVLPPNIEPIDAAAHLKLLGESLTIIGERLKEHEGQIAVSGSLSVLLDSLLCSLAPLLCLTMHIPGLEMKHELSDNLAATLDNIAYVMPGL